jgi:crossover junction endodeoxyribonuclease RuvC
MPECIAGIDTATIEPAISFFFPLTPNRVSVEDIAAVNGQLNAALLAERVKQMRPSVAFIERVGAMPKQGVASTFRFGAAFGGILGVLAALEIPVRLITPSEWKKHFKLVGADKEASRALAIRTFPACASHFSHKRDHNRAEEALLAAYGAKLILKGE